MFFNQFVVFGHRGGTAAGIVENTAEAFRYACQSGVKAVEFDVMLTSDGVPVVSHDETLDRLGGCPDRIDALTAETLRQKVRLNKTYVVPTFAEMLDLLKIYYEPMNVEIKPSRKDELTARNTAQAVVAVLTEKDLASSDKVLISSFSRAALEETASLAPALQRALLVDVPRADDFDFARRIGAVAIHIPAGVFSRDYVAAAEKNGLKVCVYTINDSVLALRARQDGAAGVFSDCPQEIQKVLA